ncbi:unnamed protein product, partial [Adineta steineri]
FIHYRITFHQVTLSL